MYDELISALRNNADHYGFVGENGLVHLLINAADAIEELQQTAEHYHGCMNEWFEAAQEYEAAVPKWIPVTERLPSDFVSVQAHMTDAGNFPPVREAYVVNKTGFSRR